MNWVIPPRAVLAGLLLVGPPGCTGADPNGDDQAGAPVAASSPSVAPAEGGDSAVPEASDPADADRVVVVRDPAYPRSRVHVRFVRFEGQSLDTRPDCGGGDMARAMPGHSGWRSLRKALLELLKHPGGDRAAVVTLPRSHAVAVVFRKDGSVRARSALEQFDMRWFPQNIALCRRAFR